MDLANSGVTGLCFIGRFEGVDESNPQRPALNVSYDYQSRDGLKTRTRSIEFVAFSAATGNRTPVGDALAGCQTGDLLAVGVWAEAHPGGTSRSGKRYDSFVTYRAMSIVRLVAVDELLHAFPGAEAVNAHATV